MRLLDRLFPKVDQAADHAKPQNLQFYIYRSSAKIDMLWDQIDARSRNKISKNLKMKLAVIEAGATSEEKDANLQAKLDIVLRDLEEKGILGDLVNGQEYVCGALPMSWREIRVNRYMNEASPRMILFTGYASEIGASGLRVGLVGSSAYVTGTSKLEPAALYYLQPEHWETIKDNLDVTTLMELEEELEDQIQPLTAAPSQHTFDFVARVFSRDDRCLIGSPLYVAHC